MGGAVPGEMASRAGLCSPAAARVTVCAGKRCRPRPGCARGARQSASVTDSSSLSGSSLCQPRPRSFSAGTASGFALPAAEGLGFTLTEVTSPPQVVLHQRSPQPVSDRRAPVSVLRHWAPICPRPSLGVSRPVSTPPPHRRVWPAFARDSSLRGTGSPRGSGALRCRTPTLFGARLRAPAEPTDASRPTARGRSSLSETSSRTIAGQRSPRAGAWGVDSMSWPSE